MNDEGGLFNRQRHNSQLHWDHKKKRFIRGSGEGADNVKIVKTESGTRLPATYRSGRFDEWKAKNRVVVPRVGEKEDSAAGARAFGGNGRAGKPGRRFVHTSETPAKPLHKLNKDYERKTRQLNKKMEARNTVGEVSEGGGSADGKGKMGAKAGAKGGKQAKKTSRYGGKPIGKVRSELKSAEQIRKARLLAERRKAKNARPSKKRRK